MSDKGGRLQRELERLRASPSLRLGIHVTEAMRKPWRAPFLPITLPWKMFMIGLEMLGRRPAPQLPSRVTSTGEDQRNCAVFFPTNGVGFGHFTRMLALAKRMKSMDPELEVVFFTTMPTLHLLKAYDIPAHHISGPKYFKDMDSQSWNALVEEELGLCFAAHRPKLFIFDGAFPYRGMLRAIAGESFQKIWMRRGTFRKGTSIPVDSIAHFQTIIHPEDSVPRKASEIEHEAEVLTCPPIILLDSDELWSREAGRQRIGVPLSARVVYLQLGAGQINDIESEIRLTIESLLAFDDVHVVLGESMIGERLKIDLPRVHILRDYPNSMYFNGFDATIQAGGYNSFHETRAFGLPALFYPNMETGMDDQLARCMVAEEEGWGIVVQARNPATISDAVERLLSLEVENPPIAKSGAWDLAEMLV